MTQTVILELTDDLIDRARKQASQTDQPMERVLVQQLEAAFSEPLPSLPTDEQTELNALVNLSIDALWTIAREQMPRDQQNRMQILMDGNSKGSLSKAEFSELEKLVEQGQRVMLRKAKAATLLTERGYKVTPKDMTAQDE
ncbi:MAG: hypothetical protein H0X30_02295 [Anaerolineae bacterium]|nr:hypothetical protein [Anaerolineae bacterium]